MKVDEEDGEKRTREKETRETVGLSKEDSAVVRNLWYCSQDDFLPLTFLMLISKTPKHAGDRERETLPLCP